MDADLDVSAGAKLKLRASPEDGELEYTHE